MYSYLKIVGLVLFQKGLISQNDICADNVLSLRPPKKCLNVWFARIAFDSSQAKVTNNHASSN